jgi:cellulose synthase/poly-beta-1,6-N-acetylglucosamine synthase-like glycosyltransferase
VGSSKSLSAARFRLVFIRFASEEVPLNWDKWIRQTHRWLSMAFTVAVIFNIVAIAQKKYTNSVGLLAVAPLALQFFTGLYLFVLPYAIKWRSTQRTGSA